MNFLTSAIAASVMLTAISCNRNENSKEIQNAVLQNEQPAFSLADTAILPAADGLAGQPEKKSGTKNVSSTSNADWDKKIIKNGTLNIEVEDYRKYNSSIRQFIKKWEAYVSSEEENSSDYKIENVVTIKIPVQYFDEAIQQLSTQEGKLLVKQIQSQDVTGEYLDTRSRMEARKKIRLRYLDMLQKAKNMEEVLQVEKEINAMQEQIEAAEGRVHYLNHSASYSTIQLTFFQVLNPTAIDQDNPGFGKRILLALTNGLTWVSELIIVLVTLWPVWLVIVFAIWMIRRVARSRKIVRPAQ